MTNDPTKRNAEEPVQPDAAQPQTPVAPAPATDKPAADSLAALVNPLLEGLLYPSESDEPVTFVTCYLAQEAPLTEVQIKEWQMVPPSTYVEERPASDFWEPVLTEEDWYGDDEKKRTAAFNQLKTVLDQHLTGQQLFRQGNTEVTLYLLGRLTDGTRAGVQTMVVES
ncbi:nuclease A inhibitor family protein [Spirosoma rhododendri]|uniref:Nuclease n=1 Tax=Spirosoma rhododendri TaxID=2728024 RepID=A0A7L5DWX0_9BACT|nr:nuclease A inhibitor family protein [Spirosoma rhododendri]QJD80040.1 nuclease [Spirosoma rhododendri]